MSAAPVLNPIPHLWEGDPYDHDRYEIVDGNPVEIPPMSADSTAITFELARKLSNYGIENGLGSAYTEMLLKLPLPVDRNRRPDVVFVPYSRWPRSRPIPATNTWDVLPDLFVEVVSPNDRADENESKIDEYLQAGARLVWAVYPRHGSVYVYETAQSIRRLTRADTLEAEPVLPGFRLPLAELFPPMMPVEPA